MFRKLLSRRRLSQVVRRPFMRLTHLEDRCVPASFVVNSTADSGAGTLRNQIIAANAAAGLDTITFDATVFNAAKTITLTSGEIAITGDLNINGPTAALTISGNNSSRIFNVNDAVTGVAINVSINDLTLTKGATAGVADGGAIFVQDENLTLTDCTVTANNSADAGGGLRVEAGGSLIVNTCTFSSNVATTSGGGMSIAGGPTVTLTNSTFSGNTAVSGGGVNMFQGGKITVSGCTFSTNTATTSDGGGLFLNGAFTSATANNSTFSGNFADSDGGAIALSTSFTTFWTMHNCTIAQNNTNVGNAGGIASLDAVAPFPTISLVATIVSNNGSAGTANDNLFTLGTVNGTLCLITNTTGVTTFNGDAFTNGKLGANPNIGALANNGGPTQTRALLAGSPAIDAGSNVLGLTTDQRGTGYFRTRGVATDIGAYEVPDDFVVTNTNNSGAGSLRQAVLDANAAVGLDTIVFDTTVFASAKTIALTSGELLVSEGLVINGPTAALTVSGNNASRIFHVENTGPVLFTLRDMTLTNGKVTGTNDGGAILVAGGGGVQTYTNLAILNSTSQDHGGGIAIEAAAASVTIDGCDIAGNSAATGGGVFLIGGAGLTVRNSTLRSNIASGQGGALAIFGISSFSATNSTLSANTAATGGGISWNTSGNNNGINNCTIIGNTATSGNGGGVFVFAGTTNFASAIVSGNTAANGPDIQSPGTTNVNNSAIGSAIGFTLTGASNLAFGTNLLLGPLQNNGGRTQTHAPAVNSPVLGKGSNLTGATLDQRGTGFPRVRGTTVDIGAVEVDQLIVTNTNASGAGSLLQATVDANANSGMDTITFDATVFATTKTIVPSATMTLTEDVEIQGPAAQVLVSGNLAQRIIETTGGTTFNFSDLRLTLGKATGNGGAFLDNAPGNSTIRFTDCVLSFNQASGRGGAVSGNADRFEVTDCTLSQNDTTGAAQDGGAINLDGSGSIVLTRTTVSGNQATGDGGGIASRAGSPVVIVDSTISGNSAGGNGGGLYVNGAVGTYLVSITNSTLSANTATTNGGGIGWISSSGTMRIRNSTITNNTANIAAGGGGISVATGTGNLNIESTIVSGNINAGAPDIDNPNTTSVKTTAVGDNLGWAKTDLGGNLPFQPHANLKLGVLANNGGTTLTHQPQAGSPLINVGSNPAALILDQRGAARGLSGGVDIGSTEFLNTVVKNTNDSGLDSLRQIIIDTNSVSGTQNITFDATVFATAKTITLTTGQLAITDSVNINGPAVGVTILGNKFLSRVFEVNGSDVLSVTMSNLTISGGQLMGLDGGGIAIADESLTLTDVTISGNTAGSGGGIGSVGFGVGGDITLIRCTIADNKTSGNAGGNGAGIALSQVGGSLTVVDSSIFGNSAHSLGGGVSAHLPTAFTVTNSTISGNTAKNGGGIYVDSVVALSIRNATLTANVAQTTGGGIFSTQSVALDSCIVFANSAVSGPQINAPAATVNTSLIGSKSGVTTFTGDAFTNANIGVDPLLGPLQDNGGPTLTHLPANTSKALNNGSNPAALTLDQRGTGFPRIVGTAIDIGAVEAHVFIVTNTNDAGAGSLRQALLDSNALAGADDIVFDPTVFATAKTITLTTGVLLIADDAQIIGPSVGVTVSGNNATRIMQTTSAADLVVNMANVTLTLGKNTFQPAMQVGAGDSVTLTNCKVTANTSTDPLNGGAIGSTGFQAQLTLIGCTISGNSATGPGAGVIMLNSGTLVVRDSTISGNSTAGKGGGIYANYSVTILNSTVSGNTAGAGGGGVYAGSQVTTIRNSTIVNNVSTAGAGGGIARSLTPSTSLLLDSVIVFGNSAPTGPQISGKLVSANDCLIGSISGITTFTGDTFTNANIGVNPLLGALANNGGSTLTHLPATNSKAVNAGSNLSGLIEDQRGPGFSRTFGGGVDIGAIESRALIVTNTNDSGVGSLRQAVLDANALSGPDTITFDTTVFATAKTITLTTGQMTVTDTVTVTGPTAGVTISGNNTSRIFEVDSPTSSQFEASRLTLTQGKASDGGGAILADDDLVDLTDCVLTGNTSAKGGGAIRVDGGGGVYATRCVFTNNSAASFGGAIDVFGTSSGGAKLTDCTLTGNSAGVDGGAIYCKNLFQMTGSTVSNNTASDDGGAIYLSGTFKIFLVPTVIINSTISGNTATGTGGGITITGNNGYDLGIINSTLTGNAASVAGGGVALISGTAGVTVSSSIVFGNTAPVGPELSVGTKVTADTSLIGSKTGVTTFSGDVFTNASIGINPQLGPLQNNGGLTQTHMPAVTSPALSNGKSSTFSLSTDQRGAGFPRVRGAAIDIGAVEIPVLVVTNTNDSGAGSLRQVIVDANAVAGTDTITFDPTVFATAKTISLLTTLPAITEGVVMAGTGANLLTVRRNPGAGTQFRVFQFSGTVAGVASSISGMTISGGDVIGRGGGVYVGSNDSLTLDSVVISGNKATLDGGGIAAMTGTTLTIRNSTLSGNSAGTDGGGIYHNVGDLLIENSTISGNTASGNGGGLFISALGNIATSTIRNSTFSGNSATTAGGGVAAGGGLTRTLTVHNSTIVGNSAATGGGLRGLTGFVQFDIQSTIVSTNLATTGPDVSASAKVSVGNSLIGKSAGFTLTDLGGNLPFETDPLLAPLANNGGPTQTHLPASNSPAFNAGSNPAGLADDQRGAGFPRALGGAVDIGAVEVRTLIVTNANDAGAGSLRQAVIDANAFVGADVITFDPTFFATAKTISLLTALPNFTSPVNVHGTGVNLLTVRRDPAAATQFRVFSVATSAGSATLSDMTISGGTGGILTGAVNLTLDHTAITGNTTTGNGGGIQMGASSSLLLRDSTVSGNSSGADGGGINASFGAVTIERSTISGNISASRGGGLFLLNTTAVDINNSTLSGNSAVTSGGIDVNSVVTTVNIRNSTITANSVTSSGRGFGTGGGTPIIDIRSTVIAGNLGASTDMQFGSSIIFGNCVIGSTSGGGSFTDLGGTTFNVTNPGLAPLANNGGPTQTHAILPGSILINAGSNPLGLTVDQRGFNRVEGGTADIGAFESNLAPTVRSVVINGGAAQRSRVTTVTVNFDSVVTFSGPAVNAFQLKRQSDNAIVNLSAAVVNGATTSVTLTFLAGPAVDFTSLADGRYTLTVDQSKVSANGQQLDGNIDGVGGDNFVLVGDPATNKLHRLFGDADGDGTVAANDFIQFRLALGGTSAVFDFDNDGAVAASDFIQFRLRFGGSI